MLAYAQLARLKGHEDAVLFPCGFSANMAVVSVMAADDDVDVFSDELNHASIIDGLRLATRPKVPCIRPARRIQTTPREVTSHLCTEHHLLPLSGALGAVSLAPRVSRIELARALC